MVKHGKRYNAAIEQIDKDRTYEPVEAVGLAKLGAVAKFDETVELHLRTLADPRHADQQLRGIAVLPHGTGKAVRVAVFAQADAARAALDAGAEVVGDDDLIQRVEGGFVEFDVAIATPDMMGSSFFFITTSCFRMVSNANVSRSQMSAEVGTLRHGGCSAGNRR